MYQRSLYQRSFHQRWLYQRSFHAILPFIVLGCLFVLPTLLPARASASSIPIGHNFLQTGHGVVKPQKVSTTTIPQVTSLTPIHTEPAVPIRRIKVAPPQNVVVVPPPTSTDLTAHNGLSLPNQPKPDANGVGGIYNYMETVNGGVAFYSRSGIRQFETSDQAWFGTPGAQYFDPVAMWDNIGNRFLFIALQLGTSNLMLSVAQQPNARGNFCNYTFSLLANHDFDKLGVDSDGIYFSANVLPPNTNTVVNNELFYVNRTALESCQQASYSYWTDLTNPNGSIAQAITPARQDSGSGGIEYLVNSYPAGGCQLTLWRLTSSGNLSNTSVPTQCYDPPTQAPQKGSAARIDTSDSSITQASYVNGLLTLDVPGSYNWGDGNGLVGIVEWFVINPRLARVARQGAFGTPGYWLFYPSTITTANGHMLFVYNASSPNIYPSVWYVNQSLTAPTALANGSSYYETSGVAPWGDYQSAWPDSSVKSPNSVWITGEFGLAPNKWGTSFDLVTP